MAGFFGFGNFSKPGPGVKKEDLNKPGVIIFFEVFIRKFWRLIQLNLLYFITSIPIILVYIFISWYYIPDTLLPQMSAEYASAYLFIRFCFAILLLMLFGNGPFTCGYIYVLRNFSAQQHAWVWSDFWEHTYKNLKQGLAIMVINPIALIICSINLNVYFVNGGNSMLMAMAGVLFCFAALIFTMMQFYIFPMIATFSLNFSGIMRNSVLMVLMKPFQNILLLLLNLSSMVFYIFLCTLNTLFAVLAPLILLTTVALATVSYTNAAMSKVMITQPQADDNSTQVFKDQ